MLHVMREEAATVNDLEHDLEHGGNSAESGKRRHSIVTLQNMLKKVSQSPFHNQYNDAEGSAVATHVPDNHQPHLQQLNLRTEDESGHQERLHLSPQNGVSENLVKTNPFYSYYLESTNNGHEMENGRKSSEEVKLDAIFVPPPEFQSSPLGLAPEIKTVENGAKFSEPDIFQTHKHEEDLLLTSVLGQKTAPNGDFYDLTLKTPNLSDTNGAQTQNASKLWDVKSAEVLKDKEEDLFHALKGEDLLQSERSKEVNLFNKSSSYFVDPFKSPSDEDDLFRSSPAVATNPFYNTPTSEPDLFQTRVTTGEELFQEGRQHTATTDKDLAGMSFSIENLDIFSSSSTNAVDPFQSPLTANLFQDFSSLDDPFGPTPSRSHNLLQDVSDGTPDIFRPRPAKTRESSLFMKTPSNTTVSTPSLSPSEMKLDIPASPDLFKKKIPKSPPAVPPKPLHRPQEILLTTPQGSKHDILQPTPFSQASSRSPSPNQSPTGMDHVQIFRRPPRPLPRTRPPRPVKPPQPVIPVEKEPDVPKEAPKSSPKSAFRSLPKPVFPRKPKTPKPKPVEPENFVVFEDILLIGQERCVDDWPEDSPEHNPDFKPAGKFKLRRESLKAKTDSDGGSGEDQDGSQSKKKKFKMSLLSRRSSKEKFPEDMLKGNSNTLPVLHKSSKENFTDVHTSVGENEDEELNEYRKKPMKTKVNQLFRRASTTTSSVVEQTHVDGHLLQESKKGDLDKKSIKNNTINRRWSEGNMLDDGTGEEEEDGGAHHEKTKKKVKVKFVPHRGFAITREKLNSEPKGAYGYTPRKGSKDKSSDEVLGAHGYTPHEKSKTDAFEDVEELKSQHLQSASKAKTHHYSPGLNEDEDAYGIQDCKPKSAKMKLQHAGRRSSKENMLESSTMQKKKSCFSDEEFEDEELNGMGACKPKNSNHGPVPVPRKSRTANGWGESSTFSYHLPQQTPSEGFEEDEKTGNKLTKPAELNDDEADELETCKPKKSSKLKVLNKLKHKSKAMQPDGEDPQGAAFNEHLSEAAKAEWLAAQMDECAIADLEDEEEEGDTDSLMEWWYTVEKWDEVPSDEEDAVIQKDELKSFTILADKIHNGLRLFNKVFTEKAEILWQSIILLHTIADDISEFHHKAKIAGITGGTTSAVGGVAAIAGLALAPVTFGASLLITAVGVGVAAAGGVTSASAAISDNVHRNHDRKKVEQVLKEYEDHLLEIAKILHFVNKGLCKLRGHPFLRSGTQHYSEDWEIRRAVQVISLVDSPVKRATELTDEAITSLQGLFKGMDKYFIKDTRELKKGCKKEIVAEIRTVANALNESIVELNTIREELQDATGNI